MNRGWIAVACADHVALGVAGGFMQVCHGKAAPLRRMRPGQHVAYYSPTEAFRGHQLLQAFTAIGIIRDSEPYCFDMGGGFRPWRRDVDWLVGQSANIRPLLEKLEVYMPAPAPMTSSFELFAACWSEIHQLSHLKLMM